MARLLFWLGVFTVTLIILFVACCNAGLRHSIEFRERCEAAGGIPHQPKHDWVCLDPSVVREVSR